MIATLLVNAMISTVEAICETPADDTRSQAAIAETRPRLIISAVPQWQSRAGG